METANHKNVILLIDIRDTKIRKLENQTSMNHLVYVLFLTILIVSLSQVASGENIHKITSHFSDGRSPKNGFGFIVYEEEENLYVITAKHVIWDTKKDQPAEEIYAYLQGGKSKTRVSVEHYHKDIDLALLKMPAPEDNYWKFKGRIKPIQMGDKVWILGRNSRLQNPTPQSYGTVTSITKKAIIADFFSAVIGSSGGPMLVSNKFLLENPMIAGMIIKDDGEKIYAIPIDLIMNQVRDWLDIYPSTISDLPIYNIGVWFYLPTSWFNEFPSELNTIGNQKTGFNYSLGLYAEIAVSKYISLRGTYSRGRLVSETLTKYLPSYQYQNYISEFSLTAYYHLMTMLYESSVFLLGGVSLVQINPQVNIENSGWQDLNQLSFSEHVYDKNNLSMLLGFGFNVYYYKYLFLGIELGYKHFFSNDLYIDITDPYKSNRSNDWQIFFALNVGFSIKPENTDMKILR